MSDQATSASLVETVVPAEGDDVVLIDAETGEPMVTDLFAASASETTAVAIVPPPALISFRSKVEEILICSVHGEVLHQWQCRNVKI